MSTLGSIIGEQEQSLLSDVERTDLELLINDKIKGLSLTITFAGRFSSKKREERLEKDRFVLLLEKVRKL